MPVLFFRFLILNVDKRRIFGTMSPHGEEGDLISPALTLPVTAKEVVGQYGDQ